VTKYQGLQARVKSQLTLLCALTDWDPQCQATKSKFTGFNIYRSFCIRTWFERLQYKKTTNRSV